MARDPALPQAPAGWSLLQGMKLLVPARHWCVASRLAACLQATNAVTQPLVPLYAYDNITDGSPQTSTSLTQPAAENRILVQFNTPSPNATAPSELELWLCHVLSGTQAAGMTKFGQNLVVWADLQGWHDAICRQGEGADPGATPPAPMP